ncbi:MAG: DUF1905 domain-containing protein [Candidatus Saccharibacteria bacterium]|nr:DUF1905 domain-containing protein [Candidatus Saccharibacteria bacterium]
MVYTFKAELWLYAGDAAWHFITIPKNISQEIKAITAGPRRGFGSVRVTVSVGAYSWKTSIFPDAKTSCYLLPVKKEARTKNDLWPGDNVQVSFTLIDY